MKKTKFIDLNKYCIHASNVTTKEWDGFVGDWKETRCTQCGYVEPIFVPRLMDLGNGSFGFVKEVA